jgi:hypothetical protein
MWRPAPDRSYAANLDGAESTSGLTGGELAEILAIVRRAESRGFDPRRVLVALGVDPLTLVTRDGPVDTVDGSEGSGPRDGSRPGPD